MKHLTEFIIKRQKLVIIIFALLSVTGTILFFFTPVNYNMMDYLPAEANSTIAIDKMTSEFEQPITNLNVMVEDISLQEALAIKQDIIAAEHVKEVIWLDDSVDLKEPLEVLESSDYESYYKNENALFMVTVEDGEERAAIAAVKEAVGKECKVSGTAADQAESQDTAVNEAVKSIILLVPIIILLLVLATTSWIEPLFYLMTLGAAVLINLGTNFFLGEISFVTLAAAPILQLAVSLDYTAFLSHSFAEHKRQGLKPTKAMRMAIMASSKSISASMLTTLFGFMALMFMKFEIGADMGISLVKGVLLSFISTMVFLPALLLSGSKLVEKTKHRRLIPDFSGIGNVIMKLRIPVAAILAIIVLPCYLGQNSNSFFYGNSEETPAESEAYQIEQEFGITNYLVVLVPRGESAKETLLCEELAELKPVTGIVSYATMVSNKIPESYLTTEVVSQFYSENYARIVLTADCAYEGDESFAYVEKVRELCDKYYPDQYYTCGQSANMYDIKTFVQEDNIVVNWITVISIYIVLLFMTRNWMLPFLLIFTIKFSIWINMAVPYFSGDGLSYLGYLIVSTVQMGATVDYAILLTDTYMENRTRLDKKAAMKKTLGGIFDSLLLSGLTLTLSGFCLNWTSSNSVVKILGVLVGRGALLAIFMVMVLLPSLLLIADRFIPYTKFAEYGFRSKKQREMEELARKGD